MFTTKRKNSISTEAAFKQSGNTICQIIRKPISFNGKIKLELRKRCRIPQMQTCGTKRTKNPFQKKVEFIMQKSYNAAIVNKEHGNGILSHADQIRPQCEYEKRKEEGISTIPSVNDLLEQPLQNDTSEDEIFA